MRHRLERLDRIYTRCPLYFITICTASRKPLLADTVIQAAFEDFGIEAANRQILVGRYVLMPDHLHFFVALPQPAELGTWIKSLKNSISKVLRGRGYPSPHWQKGFFDHLVRSERSHEEKWQYVCENPIRRGLVLKSSDWPYSGEIAPVFFPGS